MTRGEVWTAAGGPDYAGKPRPVVILQDNAFDTTRSVTVCPVTSNSLEVPLFRPVVEPSVENGLRVVSRLMVDKITTVPKVRIQRRLGRLSVDDIAELNRTVITFLGLTQP